MDTVHSRWACIQSPRGKAAPSTAPIGMVVTTQRHPCMRAVVHTADQSYAAARRSRRRPITRASSSTNTMAGKVTASVANWMRVRCSSMGIASRARVSE